jgi:plasmid maintenance system antidote protein VapI
MKLVVTIERDQTGMPVVECGNMALRIEKAFGVKMDTLMRMQSSYDIVRTRERQNTIRIRRYQPSEARP